MLEDGVIDPPDDSDPLVLAANDSAAAGAANSNNPPTQTAQQSAVNFAQSHLGDGLFSSYGQLGLNDEVGGNIGKRAHGWGVPKCNFLVHDAYESGGAAPKLSDGSIPRTLDWFNPSRSIMSGDGGTFQVIHQAKDGPLDPSQLQPGDVITNGHHMGIYAPGPDGPTISAATTNPTNILPGNHDHPWLGGVTRNDWGFRNTKGNDDQMVVPD